MNKTIDRTRSKSDCRCFL